MTPMIGPARPELSGPLSRERFVAIVRRLFVERASGRLRLGDGSDERSLVLRDGDLFVDADHPLAARIERILRSRDDDGERDWLLAGKAEMRAIVAALVDSLTFDDGSRYTFDDGEVPDPAALLGPLPSYFLVMEAAVRGVDDDVLLRMLGGEKSRLVAVDDDAMARRLPTLDGPARQLVSRLAEATVLRELLHIDRAQRRTLLQWLVRLAALGLVRAERRDPTSRRPSERGLVPEDVLERFLQRLGNSIGEDPVEEPIERHRSEVAKLIGRIGGLTHYEVLGVEIDATGDDLTVAYEELGRRVHPRNASRLGLEERAGVLRMLFERATKAYLVLSDPERRKDYDLRLDIKPEAEERSEEEVTEIRREMARENFERARQYVDAGEYHYAIEHLRDIVRWDPQPEYLALLGKVMAMNPKWLADAEEYLERAVEGAGDEPAYRIELAKVYERRGRRKVAIEQYEAALVHMPGHPEAVDALERLTFEEAKEQRTPFGWFLRWLTGE